MEWVADVLGCLRAHGHDTIEATPGAADEWTAHVQEVADATLYPTTDSWYMGANIPGKPRVFLPYIGGLGVYRRRCEQIAADGYPGFAIGGPVPAPAAAGWSWRWSVMALDEATAALIAQSAGRPRVPELTVAQARQLDRAAAARPASGTLDRRRRAGTGRRRIHPGPRSAARGQAAGPHRLLSRGGWVLGGPGRVRSGGRGAGGPDRLCGRLPRLPAGAGVPLSHRRRGRLGGAALGGRARG